MRKPQHTHTKSMFETILTLFKVGGILRFFDTKISPSKNLFYTIYCILVIFHPLQFFLLELMELKNTLKVYEELLDQLVFFPIHLVTIIKIFVLCWNYKDINRIMRNIQFEYKFLSSFGGEFKANLNRGVKQIRIITTIYCCGLLTMTMITTGTPLLKIFMSDDVNFGEEKCRKMLILYSVIPFPTSTKWFCVVAYIFQLTAAVIYVIHVLACDTLFVTLLLHLNIDVKILCDLFRTTRIRSLEKLNLPEDYSLLYDNFYPELEREVNEDMRKLTMSLQRLLEIASDVEDIFRHITFLQIMFSLSNLMCCLFITTNFEAYSPAFFLQLQVYCALAIQLSVYCVFADSTTLTFSEIPYAIYENDWFSASKPFKVMMILNMMRMNRPVVFTAGKFVELTLPLLVRILRMSYSYYTVLRK